MVTVVPPSAPPNQGVIDEITGGNEYVLRPKALAVLKHKHIITNIHFKSMIV